MTDETEPRPDGPGEPERPPFKLRTGLVASIEDMWASRSVAMALASRQLRARYKHTALGYVWAVIATAVPLAVLVFVRNQFARRVPGGTSTVLFVYLGLMCWQYFASAVGDGSPSLISDSAIVTRVRADRSVFPLSRLIIAAVDSSISIVLILGIVALRRELDVSPWAVIVPVMVAVVIAQAAAWALLLSVLVVYVRDVRPMISLLLGLGLFVSPVLWGFESLPRRWRLPMVAVNPLTGSIDTLRRTLAYGRPPSWPVVVVAIVSVTVLLLIAIKVFRRALPAVIDLA